MSKILTKGDMGFMPTRARALVDAAVQGGAPDDLAELVREALRRSQDFLDVVEARWRRPGASGRKGRR